MFAKILVPLDGSEFAERALEPAVALARKFEADIVLLRVAIAEEVVVGLATTGPQQYDMRNMGLGRAQREADAYLDGLRLRWLDAGVPMRTTVLIGTPPELIVAAAKAEGADLIVMSTHGRSGIRRLVYGSVTEAVLRGARVPVLSIPLAM